MRRLLILLVVTAPLCLGACDEADPVVTAKVRTVSETTVCLEPEQDVFTPACYRYSAAVADVLVEGACVSIRLPDRTDPERQASPIKEALRLDRRCTPSR